MTEVHFIILTSSLVPLQNSGTSQEFTASRQTVPLDTNYGFKKIYDEMNDPVASLYTVVYFIRECIVGNWINTAVLQV
jgi:hypothetical protein